jgi:hypothetical protein
MPTSYTWDYQIELPPYDKLMEVLEAFFASYPGGDYACERRERFRIEFRRGLWRKGMLGFGQLVPDRLVKGQFNQWPVIVRVLARPAPSVYTVTVRYELHLPSAIRQLGPNLQSSVHLHTLAELEDLARYLAQCTGLDSPPEVKSL